ncbi:hypothetical protein F3Y22_tig00110584pilonHSYRG00139 [Hibiscus syriacus]|uniref:Uncharacterized protein n=1 Tax=Hibiscus syriacus TaxID=106335 RepID=A0A6A3A5Q4_HIBSY|nr:hypothetical protein F3Y22_tig00110584pilonHSYRG00139 [Hibiscus syriacus]
MPGAFKLLQQVPHLFVHIVGNRSNPFSLILAEICSHKCLLDFEVLKKSSISSSEGDKASSFVLYPDLGSFLGGFDFWVITVAFTQHHLLLLMWEIPIGGDLDDHVISYGRAFLLA